MGRYITNINSYQDNELLLLKQGIAKNHKEFLTVGTDTWTIDHDVIVRVRVWGGGGGGGGLANITGFPFTPGAGGGAGGVAEAILRLAAGTYNITVGAGGAGGNGVAGSGSGSQDPGTTGKDGGSSSFHTYITCSGGYGGIGGTWLHPVDGGLGGSALFDWNGFDGFLCAEGRVGGAGGSIKIGYYIGGSGNTQYATYSGFEGGAGESGGPARYALRIAPTTSLFPGGGGGGYNPPFIYGTNVRQDANSGRGVGTGGAGGPRDVTGSGGRGGFAGRSGAVVIEWN